MNDKLTDIVFLAQQGQVTEAAMRYSAMSVENGIVTIPMETALQICKNIYEAKKKRDEADKKRVKEIRLKRMEQIDE